MTRDHDLEVLLSLDGFEFQFARGYRVKIAARQVEATSARPHGVRYSLTLHDLDGRRIYGIDNAHRSGAGRPEFDHRHVYGFRRIAPYVYRGRSGFSRISIGKLSACCAREARYENEYRNVSAI